MRTRPPSSWIRSCCRFMNRSSWRAASLRNAVRSTDASLAISPSFTLRSSMAALLVLGVVLEIGSHPLAEEHRVVALEHPLAGPVADGPGALVGLEAVDRGVVGQVEQDDVVEVPAVGHVVPTQEADPELGLVVADLAGEDGAHEEREEGIPTATDGEERGQDGH